MKSFFLFFHLNLSFSSIAESDKKKIIKKCYWKILEIIEKNSIPISLEMSGYTLSEIYKLDKKWIGKFKSLAKRKLTSLIGSGFCQIIGPLCPYEINNYNIKFGNKIYKNILGIKPKIFHINEQCFSKSLVDIIANNDFKSIIMEFENPYEHNKQIKFKDKFLNHRVKGIKKNLNLIWNSSANFQKFQKYIYGKEILTNYLNDIKKFDGKINCIYGSDAEVFDFRPKRNFQDEKIKNLEWERIKDLLNTLSKYHKFQLIDHIVANKNLKTQSIIDLSSSTMPCPTKKQDKYNLNRWALSSHQNYILNTKCYNFYNFLKKNKKLNNKNNWKKLVYFFSSDFRTNIEIQREKKLNKEILNFEKKLKIKKKIKKTEKKNENFYKNKINKKNDCTISRKYDSIIINYKNIKLSLNILRFLSLNYYQDDKISKYPLIGTLRQGFFQKSLNYDLYSFHLITEFFDNKFTDISYVAEPKIYKNEDSVIIRGEIVNKKLNFSKKIILDLKNKSIEVINEIDFFKFSPTLIRAPIITFNPKAFDVNSLGYSVKNGGEKAENFHIKDNFSFGSRVSNIVSSTTSVGFNDGILRVYDKSKEMILMSNHQDGYSLPLLEFKKIEDSFLLRASLSMRENDDTSRNDKYKKFKNHVKIKFKKLK